MLFIPTSSVEAATGSRIFPQSQLQDCAFVSRERKIEACCWRVMQRPSSIPLPATVSPLLCMAESWLPMHSIPFVQQSRLSPASLAQAHVAYHTAYFRQLAPALRNASRIRKLLSAPAWLRASVMRLAGNQMIGRMIGAGDKGARLLGGYIPNKVREPYSRQNL